MQNAPRRKLACITLHPHLPGETIQKAGFRSWGTDGGTIYTDDVRHVRTTKWALHMPERARMLNAVAKGDEVFFRTALCLGFSEPHLRRTAEAIWGKGAGVYIQTLNVLLKSGDDLREVSEAAKKEKDAARARVSRKQKGQEQAKEA